MPRTSKTKTALETRVLKQLKRGAELEGTVLPLDDELITEATFDVCSRPEYEG